VIATRLSTLRPLLVLTLAVALAGVAAPAAQAAERQRPNIVVVMTDDQDFRSMWALPKTRRLITDRGTTFATNVVNFPLCCPSRATYYTGEYAHNHGVLWNTFPEGGYYRFKGKETMPVWLQRAGYRTIHIGKYLNQYGERDPREVPPGWSDWHGGVDPSTYDYYGYTINNNGHLKTYGRSPADYSVDVDAGLAEQAIGKARRAGKPFFLNVAPLAPHTVAVASRATREGTPALPAPRYANVFANTPLPRYPNFNEADMSDKPAIEAFFPNPLTDTEIAELTAHYRGRMGSLLAVDDLVERIVKSLKRNGVYRNTVIVFTSDNGWILGEHRLRDPLTQDGKASGVKYVPFEGSSRVPLAIAGPGFPAKHVVKGVTVNADLAPTILSIAHAHATLPEDGLSLLRAAQRPALLSHRGVLIETAPNPRSVPPYTAIRTRRYRLEVAVTGDEGLYDLWRDPWELQSVHADPRYARIKAILAKRLATLRTCKGASCRKPVPALPAPGR
jgi:arylsulfatase A-like enzyme